MIVCVTNNIKNILRECLYVECRLQENVSVYTENSFPLFCVFCVVT